MWICLLWTYGIKKHWKKLHELIPKVIKCTNHIPCDFLPPAMHFSSHSSMKINWQCGCRYNFACYSCWDCLHWWFSDLELWTICCRNLIFLNFLVQYLHTSELYRIIHNNNNQKFTSSSLSNFLMTTPITSEYCNYWVVYERNNSTTVIR